MTNRSWQSRPDSVIKTGGRRLRIRTEGAATPDSMISLNRHSTTSSRLKCIGICVRNLPDLTSGVLTCQTKIYERNKLTHTVCLPGDTVLCYQPSGGNGSRGPLVHCSYTKFARHMRANNNLAGIASQHLRNLESQSVPRNSFIRPATSRLCSVY